MLIIKMEPLKIPLEMLTSEVIEKYMTTLLDDYDEKYGVSSLED